MSERRADKGQLVEDRTKQTRYFVRWMKATTWRKYTVEEKTCIILEVLMREGMVIDQLRKEGIRPFS